MCSSHHFIRFFEHTFSFWRGGGDLFIQKMRFKVEYCANGYLHSNILLATSQCFEKPFNNTRDYGVHVRKEIIPNTCTPKKVKKVDWGRTDKKKLLGCRGVNCVTLKWLCWLTNTVQNITNNSIGIHIERKIEIRYVSVLQCFFVLFSWNYYDVNNITKCKYGLT